MGQEAEAGLPRLPAAGDAVMFPQQPTIKDDYGVLRFQRNEIVRFLLDAGPFDLNKLALMPFTDEDRCQLAQLIGYSVSGYEDLSYVQALDEADAS